jgi:hypothetical protein
MINEVSINYSFEAPLEQFAHLIPVKITALLHAITGESPSENFDNLLCNMMVRYFEDCSISLRQMVCWRVVGHRDEW